MVQKEELRIGNLLKAAKSLRKYAVVKGITETGILFSDGYTFDFKDIEPIKLTPEILESSGFIYGRKYCDNDFYDIKKTFDLLDNEVWEIKRNNQSLKYLRYVHEAQNIFYEISRQELEITF